MKSTIKVSYQARYGNNTEREPVIKVDLAESDDPRDLLLQDLFEDGASIGMAREQKSSRMIGPEGEEETILFYRKKPHQLIQEISFDVVQTIDMMFPEYRFVHVYDGVKSYYFTTELETKFQSEPIDINTILWAGPYDLKKIFINNFKKFFAKLNDKNTPMSFDLAKALSEFEPQQWETLPDGTEFRGIQHLYDPYLEYKSRENTWGRGSGFNSTTGEINL